MFELPAPENDGLIIPPVGKWSKDKHYFLLRYLDAFTTAMRKKKWDSLHYIDLFAGAGIEQLKDSGELTWGSPLIAAQVPIQFHGLHYCELNDSKASALKNRLMKLNPKAKWDVLVGDANEKVQTIIPQIPNRALSIAFLDPFGLHLHFETLTKLAKRRVDLIIFFPDHLDALRNWQIYKNQPNSNLDLVLGSNVDWQSAIDQSSSQNYAETIRNIYVKQIKSLGYTEIEYERIYANGHPLYLLIFCSKNKAGAKIWRRISNKKPDGQRTLDF